MTGLCVMTGSASAGFFDAKPRFWWWGAVAVVLTLALGLRAWRLNGPYEHFDEQIAVSVSQHLARSPGWDTNWKGVVPAFAQEDQYNFSAYIYATHLFRRTAGVFGETAFQRERDGLYVHRVFSILCGTMAVLGLVLVVVRHSGTTAGVLAGLLMAINPQLVQDAHYARPEAFMTLLVVVLTAFALQRVELRSVIIMGLLVGLLTATKATNGLFLIMPAVAILGQSVTEAACSRWQRAGRALRWLVVLGLAAAAGWALGVPGAVWHWPKYVKGLQFLSAQYNGEHPPHSYPDHRAVWAMMGAYYRATLGWPLLAAAIAGGLVMARRREWRMAAVLLPLAACILIFGSHRVFFERNLSPVVPGALWLAAVGTIGVFGGLLGRGRASRGALALATLVLMAPAARTVELFETCLRPSDGLERFQAQVRQDFPRAKFTQGSLYDAGEFDRLARELDATDKIIYEFTSFNDAYTAQLMPELDRRFRAAVVGEYRGNFADYPTCSLNTMHGPRWHVYLLSAR